MCHVSYVPYVFGCPSLSLSFGVDPQQVVKVDCDTHKDLMNLYKARGLPLMVIFNGGKVRPTELIVIVELPIIKGVDRHACFRPRSACCAVLYYTVAQGR